jgi:hypothetical protein
VVVLAGDGVAHNDLMPRQVHEEDATVAAPEHIGPPPGLPSQVEALGRNAVRRV